MEVIDLLNKIASGEEVPQKIKIGNKIYNYETFNIGKGDNYFTAEEISYLKSIIEAKQNEQNH